MILVDIIEKDIKNIPSLKMHQTNQTISNFSLSKWYMDCVDANGHVFIGYSAFLKWKKMKLNYTNILYFDEDGGLQTNTSFKKLPHPVLHGHCLTWSPSWLNLYAQWHSAVPPIKKTLFKVDSGAIDWWCCQPKAKAEIHLPNQTVSKGLGYTEQLTMTLKPWELPLTELRWGRFLAENHSIVWIRWTGKTNLNLVYYQGNPVSEAIVTDDFIRLNQGEFILNFSDTLVLREGSPISTALSPVPGLKKLFPRKILNTSECKWRSKGVLMKHNKPVSYGWVIHEVVKWDTEFS